MKQTTQCPVCKSGVNTSEEHFQATLETNYGYGLYRFHVPCFPLYQHEGTHRIVHHQHCVPDEF